MSSPPPALYQIHMPRLFTLKEKMLKECKFCSGNGWQSDDVMCMCLTEVMFQYRLSCSNIPAKYRNASFDQFAKKQHSAFKEIVGYTNNLKNARDNGIGLHVHSAKSGTGKTLLMACVLHEAMKKGYWVWFTSMAQLMEDIRRGYDDERQRESVEWAMFGTDFLLLDELTKTHDKNGWVEDRANDLIQRRVNDNRPILTTDQHPIAKLTEKYRDHIISRFVGQQMELSVELGSDFRAEHQKKQLKELLYGGAE